MFRCYRQLESSDCGLTCVRMIANHYGKKIPMRHLRELTRTCGPCSIKWNRSDSNKNRIIHASEYGEWISGETFQTSTLLFRHKNTL